MKRTRGLRSDPDKVRAWKTRSAKALPRTEMTSTPSKRKKADSAALKAVTPDLYVRSGGSCELRIKGVCEGRATNRHHRLGEGQGGPSILPNLIHVCGMGNATGCHGHISTHRDEAYENGWLVKMGEDPTRIPWRRWTGWFL